MTLSAIQITYEGKFFVSQTNGGAYVAYIMVCYTLEVFDPKPFCCPWLGTAISNFDGEFCMRKIRSGLGCRDTDFNR